MTLPSGADACSASPAEMSPPHLSVEGTEMRWFPAMPAATAPLPGELHAEPLYLTELRGPVWARPTGAGHRRGPKRWIIAT